MVPGQIHPTVTVVVPTLAADETLDECLASLDRQTFRDFEVIVVDNSGRRRVKPRAGVRIVWTDPAGAVERERASASSRTIATSASERP